MVTAPVEVAVAGSSAAGAHAWASPVSRMHEVRDQRAGALRCANRPASPFCLPARLAEAA
jgi:hypothetical protein